MTTPASPDGAPLRVLVLEDVLTDAELEVRELRRAGIAVEWTRVETETAFREALVSFDPGIVLADFSLPGWNGMAALAVVRSERPDLPFIVVTGALDEETAADCIKRGADDYVLKERLSRLPHAVRSARDAWATRVARRAAEEELRLRNSALEAAADGVLLTDLDGRIAWANPAFTEITGWRLEEIRGRNPNVLKSGLQRDAFYRQMWETILAGGVWRGELYNRRKDGSIYLEEMTITPVRNDDGAVTHFVAIKEDLTSRRRQEELIRSLATRDPLTGLPNQVMLREDLERALAGGGASGTLVMLDLDRFALLNDALGHPAGDRLLIEVAERLSLDLPRGGTLYRFGGDEFVILLPETGLEEAGRIAEQMRHTVDGIRIASEGVVFDVSASLGLAPVESSPSPARVDCR